MSWMRMTYKSYLQYGRKCLEMTMTTLYALIGIHLFLLYYPPSHYASYSRLIYEWWYHMSTFAYASMLIIGGLMHLHNCHAKSDLWNSTFSSWLTNIMLGVIKVLCLWKDDIQWPLKLKIRWAGLFVTKELSVAMSIGCFYSWECIVLQSTSDNEKHTNPCLFAHVSWYASGDTITGEMATWKARMVMRIISNGCTSLNLTISKMMYHRSMSMDVA